MPRNRIIYELILLAVITLGVSCTQRLERDEAPRAEVAKVASAQP